MKEYSINEIAELTGKTVKFVRREVRMLDKKQRAKLANLIDKL